MGCMFRGPVPAPVTLDLANTPTNLDLERYAERQEQLSFNARVSSIRDARIFETSIYPMSDGWVPPCYPKEEELIEYEEKMKARKKATLVKRHLCVKEPQLQRLSKRAFAQKSEYSMLAYAIAEGEYSGEGDDRSYFVIVFYEPAKKSKVERAFKSVGAALADYEQVVVDPDSKMEQEEKFMFAHGAGDPGECILGEYEYQVVPKGSPEYDSSVSKLSALYLCSSWLSGTCAAKGPARSVPRMRAAAGVLAFAGPSQAFYLPGVAPIEYADGGRVELKVNKLTSVKTQLPYGYYTLPFCKPDSVVESVENLGEILAGDLIENSPFDLRMGENEKCKMLCKKPLEAADKDKFRSRIDDEYLVNFIVDNLPAATKYVRKSDGGEFTHKHERYRCDWVAKFAATQDAWHQTEVAVPDEHGIALAEPIFGPRTGRSFGRPPRCTQDDEMPEDPEKESLRDEDSRWLGADFSAACAKAEDEVCSTDGSENSLDQMRKSVAAAKLSKNGGLVERSRESEQSSRIIWKQTNQSTWSYLQAVSRVILRQRVFDALCGSIIILNAAFIGAQVEYEAVNPGEPELGWWLAGQAFFCFAYVTELTLRVVGQGKNFFGSSDRIFCQFVDADTENARWNVFDIFVTLTSVVDLLPLGKEDYDAAIMLQQGLNQLKHRAAPDRVDEDLHSQGSGVARCEALMAMIMFKPVSGSLNLHDGFLSRGSMYTLLLSITSGISWVEPASALSQLHFVYAPLFVLYICFMYFAMMNVVTGFFCEHAFEMARSEKDSLIQEQLRRKNQYLEHFRQIFEEGDCDESGEISYTEFENFMQDEHLQAYLSHLNVDPDNAWQIFRLIDSNKDGSVTLEEFTTGLLTMKGPAKAIDVKGIVYDVRKEAQKTKRRMKRIDARLRDIKSQIAGHVNGDVDG
ncbi:TMN8 [Symbiodinium sp. KB8]|nr:TMN8 [Symbiodinium sp. KB8]